MEVIDSIYTPNAVIKKYSNGIVSFEHLPGVRTLTMKDFEDNYRALKQVQQGQLSPMLGDVTGIENVGNEEKAFMKSRLPEMATALAMLNSTHNMLTVFSINTFLYLHRPSIPTKVFASKKNAID